jgi:uncharacterized protein (DUF362 family)/Pyruvate/2-oxoacid:ferredoxin oxidoreductase delta subunit
MDNRVSIVKCENYDEVQRAVDDAISLLGGMEKFVKSGDRVVIKPNYVMKKNPEEAATTHPAFLHAVIVSVERAGGIVTIAESPGGPYNSQVLKSLYTVCGAYDAIKGTNAKLNFDTSFTDTSYPQGHTIKNMPLINPVLDADVVISLPKLKTHAMTSYTGAVKNLFGVIPGTHKAELHFRLDDRKAFCSMLVDLYECIKPDLSIMDGVWGMEGNGPTSGQNRHIGLVMASANGHALDMAACKIIDYTPEEVDTVYEAVKRGLCASSADGLDILGESINELVIKDFLKPESHFNLLKLVSLPAALNAKVIHLLSSRPEMHHDKCIGCGECMRCCPPKAITMNDTKYGKRPFIDTEKCIRCFCCQELCPKKAVGIKRPLLNRLMLKILK